MVQPPDSMGLLCSPVTTQGRSYKPAPNPHAAPNLWERPCVAIGAQSAPISDEAISGQNDPACDLYLQPFKHKGCVYLAGPSLGPIGAYMAPQCQLYGDFAIPSLGVLPTNSVPLYNSSQIGAFQRPQPGRLDDLKHVDQIAVIDLSPPVRSIGHLACLTDRTVPVA
ncbi:hypothetical protein SOX05_15625 [Pseudomonas putida]|uniref:hypothetical protein n=1 Tax=Pseudomonas TaxID=286 RepID=UPI000FFC9DCF|nr:MULTISPECIES: hypothetical protein [Pseudomonas]MDY4311313.1 hypothetical protein [Pseudomonas putida]MBF8789952.1 hypothetical protein [Pseudomonas asiatica]MDY4320899.1 hypothetical protein [Pseudomonas putida]MDY4354002.1 hypothetical protein [Pseudomonas putida]WIV22062.1 hypothetical protein QN085_15380 [Pseudomonas sp. M2(2023)]